MALSRRFFLTLPAACYAQTAGKGRVFGATVTRYADPATELKKAHEQFRPILERSEKA
jgi:hypothetical protein